MKSFIFLVSLLSTATALTSQKLAAQQQLRVSSFRPPPLSTHAGIASTRSRSFQPLLATKFPWAQKEETVKAELVTAPAQADQLLELEGPDWVADSKTVELVLLSIWLISLSGFILVNNFVGPWPLFMKQIPERYFFLSHMIGGMLFGGGIILTTCIERLVSKSNNIPVLQFWFDKVPVLDGLIVVPALTISMISGTGLSIVRYGGLNIAPPHVGAIFWTLIAFMTWWAVTDLTTQGSALTAVNEMYSSYEDGEEGLKTPEVVVNRHFSNVVSCFFVVLLYSLMVLKPGTLFPFPWATWS